MRRQERFHDSVGGMTDNLIGWFGNENIHAARVPDRHGIGIRRNWVPRVDWTSMRTHSRLLSDSGDIQSAEVDDIGIGGCCECRSPSG